MGKQSRDKGKTFERAWANVLRAAFPSATVTRSTQADQAHEPDVIVRGATAVVDRIWWECRHADAMSRAARIAKLEQAERDSAARATGMACAHTNAIPIAITRRTGAREMVATMRLGALEKFGGFVVPSQMWGVVVEIDAEQLVRMLGGEATS